METNKNNKPATPKASSLLTWLFYALFALLILLIGYKAYQERQKNVAELADKTDMNEALRDDVGFVNDTERGSTFDANGEGAVYPDSAIEKPTINDAPSAVTNGPDMKDTGIETDADMDATSTTIQDDDAGESIDVDNLDAGPAASSGKDRYMIITGTFRQMINAEAEVKKLTKKGFGEAKVGKFNRGAYACSVAYSTNDLGEARAVASRLRRAGFVDTFVKDRNTTK